MKFNIKAIKFDVILIAITVIIVAAGLYARFYSAKNGIGFFADDYYLINNVVKYYYIDLLTKPLGYEQCFPALGVVILKLLYSCFGLNHFILGGGSLIGSSLALIFMPIVTYKVCKNKFAPIISSFILGFNFVILYFTQRIKQYSTDIFFTIFLIWFGYLFFSKPVTTRKMLFFTVITILCSLLSHTSVITIACLMFYYLFLFKQDSVKTKFINFLIFIIPWSLIAIYYAAFIGVQTVKNLTPFWDFNFYINNYDAFKLFICYMFGGSCDDYYFPFSTNWLPLCDHFWYLFIPLIIGIIIILIKRDKYLFAVLILPIIVGEILGILHIYPLTHNRVCLWLCPIFILLFLIPTIYIKFNKKVISLIIIIYYLFIFDKSSFEVIKNYFENCDFRQDKSNLFIEEILKSDISSNDIIYPIRVSGGIDALYEIYDLQNLTLGCNNYDCSSETIYQEVLSRKDNIYFYDYDYSTVPYMDDEDRMNYQWIKDNMDIIYEYEPWFGGKIIKARNK